MAAVAAATASTRQQCRPRSGEHGSLPFDEERTSGKPEAGLGSLRHGATPTQPSDTDSGGGGGGDALRRHKARMAASKETGAQKALTDQRGGISPESRRHSHRMPSLRAPGDGAAPLEVLSREEYHSFLPRGVPAERGPIRSPLRPLPRRVRGSRGRGTDGDITAGHRRPHSAVRPRWGRGTGAWTRPRPGYEELRDSARHGNSRPRRAKIRKVNTKKNSVRSIS